MRLNHLQPPFNNPALRRALLGAVSQDDYMAAAAGDPSNWHSGGEPGRHGGAEQPARSGGRRQGDRHGGL
jgi:hypothetical protein